MYSETVNYDSWSYPFNMKALNDARLHDHEFQKIIFTILRV